MPIARRSFFLIYIFSTVVFAHPSEVRKTNYTVLNAIQYQHTVNYSRASIQLLLNELQHHYDQPSNERVDFIVQRLADIPYIFIGAMGEGDWQPNASRYQGGAIHIKQDPVYRLDALDCQTFVQVVMGLLYSNNINEFDKNMLKIAYGAAFNSSAEIVHYYNRNNFVDGDWNPINEKNGWLTDVTLSKPLGSYAATTAATLTRQQWFLFQQRDTTTNVRVLADASGPAMVQRGLTTYAKLNYPHFRSEKISMRYIPKGVLALQQADGGYQPNQALFDSIPTPAVVEIVRDVKKWTINGRDIKNVIGTELTISHLGLLYRKAFHRGDLIYRKISCNEDDQHKKNCQVTPIICLQKQCNELMFVHATDAHPNGYYWYKKPNQLYTCSSTLPVSAVSYTQCNRVEQQPLFNYLTDYQYGSYWYMNDPSILGVHIEKLT